MNWAHLAEERITEAQATGEFEALPGQGQPIDLTGYFAMPEDLRAAYSFLKSAHILPQEAVLLKEVGLLREQVESATTLVGKERLKEELRRSELVLAMTMERFRRR